MSEDQPITLTIDGPVRWLAFDRPDKANALNLALARDFLSQVRDAAADPACTVLVLTGRGRFFSAGGDVAQIVQASDPAAFVDELAGTMHTALVELRNSQLVVVAAVGGMAAGAGAGIAFSADITICAESVVFVPAYLDAGLSPDCGVSFFLRQAAGRQRATEYLLGGKKLTAGRAHEWGLITHVVADADFSAAVHALVAGLAAKELQSWATIKSLLRDDGLAAHLDEERRGIAAMVEHPVTAARLLVFTHR